MNETKLKANYRGPRAQIDTHGGRFYWESISKRYPRVRYRLDYDAKSRVFGLTKFFRFSGSSRESQRSVTEADLIILFRSCLSPDHLAQITRLSMTRSP